MNTHTQDPFEYQAEQAKVNFQANVNSLLELTAYLADKSAKAKNKDAVFFTAEEIKVLNNWAMNVASSLMGDYTIINRANILTNKLYTISREMVRTKMPNIKELLA